MKRTGRLWILAVVIISADSCGILFFGFTKFLLLDGFVTQIIW